LLERDGVPGVEPAKSPNRSEHRRGAVPHPGRELG
jgi:hypothetical protein